MTGKVVEFLITVLCTSLIVLGLGYNLRSADIIIISLMIKLLSINIISRYFILLPLFLTFTLYFPIGYFYGPPDLGITASLFETNVRESMEFTQSLPIWLLLGSLLIISSFFILNHFFWKKNAISRKWRYIFIVIITAISLLKYNSAGIEKIKIIKFYYSMYHSYQDYLKDKNDMTNGSHILPSWQVEEVKGKYQNYVLIIGESMRKDYMPVYGYPVDTMPFLSHTNGIFWDGYVTTAPNTALALSRILSRTSGKDFSKSDNIITLANMANMETYWLSNQGRFGEFDSSISRIAAKSQYTYFTKHGDYASSNINDMALLPVLKQKIQQEHVKTRLFVLHLMGSHAGFCARLEDQNPPEYFENNRDMSCYLATYTVADKFIQQVVSMLNEKAESYSLIYLSDHGLTRKHDFLVHGSEHKENYESPLIIISSDDNKREYVNLPRSGFQFINAFSEWTGITEKGMKSQDKFFSQTPNKIIKVFNGSDMVDFERLPSDPVLLPNNKKLAN
ncbi:sulfatase family protein [Yersinia ruckeri]|uniref:sulfatase-like hydrolase/transferase n=1 Tax=Yersinia ruckeri TaxID=29486 RepID=UPI0005AD687A|nr:phosphoethanolamine transferase [Yersinia ruckeri]AJI94690.1 sulfatase family protein [Yersinia ruckeri]